MALRAFINEIHYDNEGADQGEFVEIAGLAGTDLTDWSLVGYSGFDGAVYDTLPLTGTLADETDGYGFLVVEPDTLQNGAPDGVALVDAEGMVEQFLSYEGTFTATDGPATGLTSTELVNADGEPVAEDFTTPIGDSLQYTGTDGEDGAWQAPLPATPDAVNDGQSFANGANGANGEPFTLQLLHASDQEAGVPALEDILAFSAVLNGLDDGAYENQLRLTSGDLFIAGPFSNASQDVYTFPSSFSTFAAVADILIQNELGWDAAAVGNHEFDFSPDGFAAVVAANDGVTGPGIDPAIGYPGALFPYLAVNLDYSTEKALDKLAADGPLELDQDGVPDAPNTLSSSAIVDVNGEPIGVLAAVTPYLASIANTGSLEVTTTLPNGDPITNQVPAETQAAQLLPEIQAEVAVLEGQGVDKIVLMTHLQESAIEQALAQQLADAGVNVDIHIGGGSHEVMASSTTMPPLRADETQQDTGLLLQPYPQVFEGTSQDVLYVNTGANYRYVSQLIATFDGAGNVVEVDAGSGTFPTDLAGVQELYGPDVTADDVASLADPEIVAIVDPVGALIGLQDGNIFGQSAVFLNGFRESVRTEETNLGNLSQDGILWYAQQYVEAARAADPSSEKVDELAELPDVHVSLGNGGGIRDFIGENVIPGGGGELIQGPTAPNPEVGKEAGDVSQLDVSNALRFDNELTVGTVSAADLLALVEHGVSFEGVMSDGMLAQSGRFGQWSGLRFSFDSTLPQNARVQQLEVLNADGSVKDVVVENGALVGDPERTFGITTSTFTADGGDDYPDEAIKNRVDLIEDGITAELDPPTLGDTDLKEGGQQDAVAEFLAEFFNDENGQDPYAEADTPADEDKRIVQLAVQPSSSDFTPIYELQGASQVSPLVLDELGIPTASQFFADIRSALIARTPLANGQTLDPASPLSNIEGPTVTTRGIVTAVGSNGFYLQDAEGDGDDATSDGIFVFSGSVPTVVDGDEVQVTAQLQERFPGGYDERNLPSTQLSLNVADGAVAVLSSDNAIPAPVILGESGRVPPAQNIEDDVFVAFNPRSSGADFFESLEAMRVTIEDALAIAPTNGFGEIFTVANQGADATDISERGTLTIRPGDFNPEKIQIDPDPAFSGFSTPGVDVGAVLGDVTGVVGYGFGNYEVIPTSAAFLETIVESTLEPEVTDLAASDDVMTVASYNVLNLDPNDADGDTDALDFRFATIGRQIASNLGAPDVVALQEIQDNSGSANDGTVAADETLQALVNAIDFGDDFMVNGSLNYDYIDNPFIQDGLSGGQPGGNIRTAFVYNTDRVSLLDGSVATIGSQEPGGSFENGRLPLVATFALGDEEVTVVNNHLSSKGGSAPIIGIEQPFGARQEDPSVNGSLDERQVQAAEVASFVQDRLAEDPDTKLVVLGDLNEFQFVSPVLGLGASGLENLVDTLPPLDRYSFIFQGNAQELDHLLVSEALQEGADFDIVHVNTEFEDTPFRASDHDPILAALPLEAAPEAADIFVA